MLYNEPELKINGYTLAYNKLKRNKIQAGI